MSNPTITRPDATEYPATVANYLQLVPEGDLLSILAAQADDLARLVGKLNDEQSLMRHPPYTWSIKQVVGHLADCERVFGYRAATGKERQDSAARLRRKCLHAVCKL